MGRPMKKNQVGGAAVYVSRKQALKKLQLSLKDFRRLSILKGIYPVEPKKRQKIAGGNSTVKTYYHMKDVQFLMHEPIIRNFRDQKVFLRRLRKATDKKEPEKMKAIKDNWPTYKLDHIVKERYPTFLDGVRDMDDALTMCFLIARLPKGKLVKWDMIQLCRRLTIEFMHYIIHSRSLRKVFISIKGIYYQADICGQTVTWVAQHNLGYQPPSEVDFKIMMTFTQFYSTLLGFINFRLFMQVNLVYPPTLAKENEKSDEALDPGVVPELPEWIATLNHALKNVNNFEDAVEVPEEFPDLGDPKLAESQREMEKLKKFQDLFKGLKVFVNREVPRESLVFIVRSFGGDVSWSRTVCDGATFDEDDETITHQIVDRPSITKQFLNRYYVQPQWVFDCVNARMLLPAQKYFIGVQLPPHLSPFVDEKEGEYLPPEKVNLGKMQDGTFVEEIEDLQVDELPESSGNEEDDENEVEEKVQKQVEKVKKAVNVGKVELANKDLQHKKDAEEEKKLAVMMIPKKRKRLYDKIIFSQKKRAKEANVLKAKREVYDKSVKRKKLGNKN